MKDSFGRTPAVATHRALQAARTIASALTGLAAATDARLTPARQADKRLPRSCPTVETRHQDLAAQPVWNPPVVGGVCHDRPRTMNLYPHVFVGLGPVQSAIGARPRRARRIAPGAAALKPARVFDDGESMHEGWAVRLRAGYGPPAELVVPWHHDARAAGHHDSAGTHRRPRTRPAASLQRDELEQSGRARESLALRTAQATNHLRRTRSLTSFTTCAIWAPGAGYADVRTQTNHRAGNRSRTACWSLRLAIVATGSHGPKGFAAGGRIPQGAEKPTIRSCCCGRCAPAPAKRRLDQTLCRLPRGTARCVDLVPLESPLAVRPRTRAARSFSHYATGPKGMQRHLSRRRYDRARRRQEPRSYSGLVCAAQRWRCVGPFPNTGVAAQPVTPASSAAANGTEPETAQPMNVRASRRALPQGENPERRRRRAASSPTATAACGAHGQLRHEKPSRAAPPFHHQPQLLRLGDPRGPHQARGLLADVIAGAGDRKRYYCSAAHQAGDKGRNDLPPGTLGGAAAGRLAARGTKLGAMRRRLGTWWRAAGSRRQGCSGRGAPAVLHGRCWAGR